MVRWKLFGRSKPKEDEEPEHQEVQEPTPQEPEETIQPETEKEPEKPTMPEYRETLYTKGSTPKKGKKHHKETINQTTWRDINAIEENVDNIRKSKKPVSKLDKKVDKILSRKKKK